LSTICAEIALGQPHKL